MKSRREKGHYTNNENEEGIGHNFRGKYLLKYVIERNTVGRIEVT